MQLKLLCLTLVIATTLAGCASDSMNTRSDTMATARASSDSMGTGTDTGTGMGTDTGTGTDIVAGTDTTGTGMGADTGTGMGASTGMATGTSTSTSTGMDTNTGTGTGATMGTSAGAAASGPGTNPTVGGAAMDANLDIIANAMNSPDHTTLVAAIKAAGLVETLKGAGPFTVFAPANAAFTALPAGTVDTLLKPQSKAKLSSVLTYHVVPGKLDAAALTAQITAGGGKAKLKTVQGGTLTAMAAGSGGVSITDAKGNVANVTTANVYQSNGVIHVVDKVLMN